MTWRAGVKDDGRNILVKGDGFGKQRQRQQCSSQIPHRSGSIAQPTASVRLTRGSCPASTAASASSRSCTDGVERACPKLTYWLSILPRYTRRPRKNSAASGVT